MKIKISKRILIYILLLLSYFEPYSIKMFMEKEVYAGLFYLLDRILAFARWGTTAFLLVDLIFKKSRIGIITTCTCILVIVQCMSLVANHDLSMNLIVGEVTCVGAALLFERLWNISEESYFKANLLFFGFFSCIGAILNVFFPYGFTHEVYKDYAVYFLGSKNYGFYFYLPFMYFLIIYYLRNDTKIPKYSIGLAALMFIGSYASNSVNSMICMLVIVSYLICWHFIAERYHLLSPKVLIMFVIVLEYIVLFGKESEVIQTVASAFGRNISFTGRDSIWRYYIEKFVANPIWGAGYDTVQLFADGSRAIHAHNFFLDNIAKYGIIEFGAIVLLIVIAGRCISKSINKKIIVFSSMIFFLILLHSLFEDMQTVLLILIFITMEKVSKTYVKKEAEHVNHKKGTYINVFARQRIGFGSKNLAERQAESSGQSGRREGDTYTWEWSESE